jgi:polyphosphate kinase 2
MPDTNNNEHKAHGELKRKDYERELARLHVEFVKLQQWIVHKSLKVCIVFEGRDGAGKGGTIKAMTERVSPRVFRVVALPAPTEREKSQMYAQRYIPHLPAAGEVVIFDRSWYNRAGVERVMGFCTQDQAKRFLQMTPLFEKVIVESGVILLKYWLEVSSEEQTRRLEARIDDGRKTWKLSDMDLKSYSRWYDYSRARDEMFLATDTAWASWYVVPSDNKRRARLNDALPHSQQDPLRGIGSPQGQIAGPSEIGRLQEPGLSIPGNTRDLLKQTRRAIRRRAPNSANPCSRRPAKAVAGLAGTGSGSAPDGVARPGAIHHFFRRAVGGARTADSAGWGRHFGSFSRSDRRRIVAQTGRHSYFARFGGDGAGFLFGQVWSSGAAATSLSFRH